MNNKRIIQSICALALAICTSLPIGARAQEAVGEPVEATSEAVEATGFKSADEIVKQITVEGRVSFEQKSLPFKFDSTELASATAKRQLKAIVDALQSPKLKGKSFRIEGHTCDLGAARYNMDLSKRRAIAIINALANGGVASSRLKGVGYGETKPAVKNSSDANRRKNRRVEIKLLK